MTTEGRKPSVDALLAAARADYGTRLAAKVAEIAAFAALGKWTETRRAAHKVRGSAATYGFSDIGALAGQVEDLLLAAAAPPDAGGRALIDSLLFRADQMAREAAVAAPREDP